MSWKPNDGYATCSRSAIIVRYAWILWSLARGKAQAAPDPDKVSSGL